MDFRADWISDFLPIGSLWLETSATALRGSNVTWPYILTCWLDRKSIIHNQFQHAWTGNRSAKPRSTQGWWHWRTTWLKNLKTPEADANQTTFAYNTAGCFSGCLLLELFVFGPSFKDLVHTFACFRFLQVVSLKTPWSLHMSGLKWGSLGLV